MEKQYPAITPILEAKKRRRAKLAALSWEEKIAIIEKMREFAPREMWAKSENPAEKSEKTAPEERIRS